MKLNESKIWQYAVVFITVSVIFQFTTLYAEEKTNLNLKEIEIITGEIPPYSYLENGETKGLIVDIVRAMAPYAGHSVKFTFYPWVRAVTMVREPDGAPLLIEPLNRSPEREQLFTWIARLFVDETVFVSLKSRGPAITDLSKAKDLSIGVLRGSPLEAQLKELNFKHIGGNTTEIQNAIMLADNRVDAWFVAAMVAPFVYRQAGLDPDELVYGVGLRFNDLHFAASKNMPADEVKQWAKALEIIKENGTYAKILAAWKARNAETKLLKQK